MILHVYPLLTPFLSMARWCGAFRPVATHKAGLSLAAALLMMGGSVQGASVTYTGSISYTEGDTDWTVPSLNLVVGGFAGGGDGTLTISGGGRVSGRVLIVGLDPGTHGLVTVIGTGSHLSFTDYLLIGNASNGEMTIDSGGVVTTTSTFLGYQSTAAGLMNISGTAGARGTLETNSITERSGSGTVNINGGILRASAAGDFIKDFEAGDIQIQAGGAFIDSNGYNIHAYSVMQGAGALTKQGLGRLYLRAANEYTGGTVIEAGALIAANTTGSATGTGTVTVNSGAALAGNGFVVSSGITLNASSMLRVGEAHGEGGNATLTLGATGSKLILNSAAGSLYQFDISGVNTSDLLTLNGNNQTAITLNGKIQVSSSTFNGLAVGMDWTLIDWNNIAGNNGSVISNLTLDSSMPDLSGLPIPMGPGMERAEWQTYISGNTLRLRIAAVPEPARALFLLLGLAVVFLRRHRGR